MLVPILANATPWHWRDLWMTPDQQGQMLMQQKKFSEAKATFIRKDWKAMAAYRAGDDAEAATGYGAIGEFYNQGNALAHLKRYQESIDAYDKVLKINPNDEDALHNKKIVQKLLKQQQQKNSDQSSKDSTSQSSQNEKQEKKSKEQKEQQPKKAKSSENKASKTDEQQSWLQLIPDDPGGLLREKFLRDYQRRMHGWGS